jgi:hypothetical protein
MIDMPMKFAGSPEEREANYNSHRFDTESAAMMRANRCRLSA